MEKHNRQSFVMEALVISASNLVVKVIGMLFKIPMTNMLQTNMGVFNAAYSIYAMLYMLSTAGLPVAISRMVAASASKKRGREISRIYRTSVLLFGFIGMACTLAMFFGADAFAAATEHHESALAIKVISPTLFFVCINSAIRGYFQGLRNMVPTALSQFIEAIIKLVLGIGAVTIAIKLDCSIAVQAACGISGLTLGMLCATLFLVFMKRRHDKKVKIYNDPESESFEEIFKKLAYIALPVTITSSAIYLSQFLDTIVIKKFLMNSGLVKATADWLYDVYTSLVPTIADIFPATFVYPIAISILPAISSAMALKKNKEVNRYIHNSIRISGIIAFPCGLGLFAVAREAIALIYGASWGGEMEVWGKTYMPIDIGANALRIMAVGVIFISLLSTTNALLQAVNKPYLPMISVGIGVVALIALEIVLVSIPAVGIYGAPVSSLVFYIIALMLNLLFLRKHRRYTVSLRKLFLKPLVCSVLCSGTAMLVVRLAGIFMSGESRLDSLVKIIFAAAAGAAVYVISMLICKGISRDEVLLLPKGRTLHDMLERKGYFK